MLTLYIIRLTKKKKNSLNLASLFTSLQIQQNCLTNIVLITLKTTTKQHLFARKWHQIKPSYCIIHALKYGKSFRFFITL
jgi:hypothetical protein